MNGFEPGEGWREVEPTSPAVNDALDLLVRWRDGLPTYWVPAVPVPPLPTEPYTVIRVTWKDGCSPAEVLTLVDDMWGDYTAGNLGRNITGFEVLAEPTPRVALYQEQQRVARDVLADVRHAFQTDDETIEMIAQRHGVSS